MTSMFSGASEFNQDISYKQDNGAWDMGSVTSTEAMFQDAIAFNKDISSKFSPPPNDFSIPFIPSMVMSALGWVV